MIEIQLHADAPEKPPVGNPCNGCGVCCSVAPCPLSRWLLDHRAGPCPALAWQGPATRYACGLTLHASQYLRHWPAALDPLGRRLALRWIAAGSGCDCDDVVVAATTDQ